MSMGDFLCTTSCLRRRLSDMFGGWRRLIKLWHLYAFWWRPRAFTVPLCDNVPIRRHAATNLTLPLHFKGVIVPALAAHSIGWAVVAMLHVMAFAVVALCWILLVCANPGAEPSLVPLPASKAILNPYCDYCDAYYACERRRHCFVCSRCIGGYDHHCSFLNTCISDSTYCTFAVLLGAMWVVEAPWHRAPIPHITSWRAGSAGVPFAGVCLRDLHD